MASEAAQTAKRGEMSNVNTVARQICGSGTKQTPAKDTEENVITTGREQDDN